MAVGAAVHATDISRRREINIGRPAQFRRGVMRVTAISGTQLQLPAIGPLKRAARHSGVGAMMSYHFDRSPIYSVPAMWRLAGPSQLCCLRYWPSPDGTGAAPFPHRHAQVRHFGDESASGVVSPISARTPALPPTRRGASPALGSALPVADLAQSMMPVAVEWQKPRHQFCRGRGILQRAM